MSEIFTLFDPKPMYPEKDFFGRLALPELPAMAYQSIFEPPDEWWYEPATLTFSIDSLNLAAACLRKFLATRHTLDWCHLQVHAVAIPSFYQAMEEDGGVTVLLPFWCWCDGGFHKEARHRQHRHMIAVAPKGHFFKNVWKKVTVVSEEKPFEWYKCLRSRSIKSPKHLMNTIGYVSQRISTCRVSADLNTNLNHFCINITFPKKFKWVLACLWEEGLQQLIYQKCRLLNPNKLMLCAQRIQNTWKICVQRLPKLPIKLVLPVSKNFFPTCQTTSYFLHLGHDRKLYFEKDDERQLDDTEWGRVQARSGNCFCRVIGKDWWTPTLYQRRFFSMIQPLKNRIAELEKENEYLKTQVNVNTGQLINRMIKKPRLTYVSWFYSFYSV